MFISFPKEDSLFGRNAYFNKDNHKKYMKFTTLTTITTLFCGIIKIVIKLCKIAQSRYKITFFTLKIVVKHLKIPFFYYKMP